MPPREDLNLPEEGPPESGRAGAGAETPPEGTEQEVSWNKCVSNLAVAKREREREEVCVEVDNKNSDTGVVGGWVGMGSGETSQSAAVGGSGQFSRSSHRLGVALFPSTTCPRLNFATCSCEKR